MREPPSDVTDADVLAAVRRLWSPAVDAVEHLPVGFGAYHWAASASGRRTNFVTLDALGAHHTAASLEAAYAAAATLAFGLDAVVAPLPNEAGRYTEPLGERALSATLWIDAVTPEAVDLDATTRVLDRLHGLPVPAGLPEWTTLVPETLADDLADRCRRSWAEAGPYGEKARNALRGRLDAVAEWTSGYHGLADLARHRHWVVTHGEPHEGNQLVVLDRVKLLDWESVKRAPAERDWRTLVERGLDPAGRADSAMLDLFDLEWRLKEISQYAAWFAAPHTGTASDRIALGGLVHELTR